MFRTVIVREYGSSLGKRGERLVIRHPVKRAAAAAQSEAASTNEASAEEVPPGRRATAAKREEEEIPFFRIGEILLPPRGVSISTDVVEEAAQRGIPISFLGASGQPFAMLTSPMLTGTVLTRRAQLRAMDNERGVELARAFVAGKLRNQASLLVYFAKAEKGAPEQRAQVLSYVAAVRDARRRALAVVGKTPDYVRETLMGFEGLGARAYWAATKVLLAARVDFEGRKGRGAFDPVNSLLNYGYGILASRVWAALLHAGLDPFAGMLHADRSGKPSLVLDAMEELRAPVVDRAVFSWIRLGRPLRRDGGMLDDETRRQLADAVLERLQAPVVVGGRKVQLGSVVQQQARSIATHVRAEGDYKPFAMTW